MFHAERPGDMMAAVEEKLKFAVFIDYDNIEIGVKSTLGRELDIECILEGLKQRGEIVSKTAYGNWSRQIEATRSFSEFGVQMVQRDSTPRGDKNGADINLALDALEMAFTRDHINAFAIISGDSDFMALVNKLKQYNKRVYIVGGKQFTSTILQRNCHEFISYESLLDILPARASRRGGSRRAAPQRTAYLPLSQAIPLLDRALGALELRDVQPQLGLLKSTMLQLDPAFNERDYGTSSFSNFAEKLVEKGYLKVRIVDNHKVVERPIDDKPSDEDDGDETPSPTRNDALQALQAALVANAELLEMGIPERELEAVMRATDPDFKEQDFGFQEFGELLNFACDKGLLRSETDSRQTLRFFPGPDLKEPLSKRAIEPRGGDRPDAGAQPQSSGRRSRSRRRRRRPASQRAQAALQPQAEADGNRKEDTPGEDYEEYEDVLSEEQQEEEQRLEPEASEPRPEGGRDDSGAEGGLQSAAQPKARKTAAKRSARKASSQESGTSGEKESSSGAAAKKTGKRSRKKSAKKKSSAKAAAE